MKLSVVPFESLRVGDQVVSNNGMIGKIVSLTKADGLGIYDDNTVEILWTGTHVPDMNFQYELDYVEWKD